MAREILPVKTNPLYNNSQVALDREQYEISIVPTLFTAVTAVSPTLEERAQLEGLQQVVSLLTQLEQRLIEEGQGQTRMNDLLTRMTSVFEQATGRLDRSNDELKQSNEALRQSQEELRQSQDELRQSQDELRQSQNRLERETERGWQIVDKFHRIHERFNFPQTPTNSTNTVEPATVQKQEAAEITPSQTGFVFDQAVLDELRNTSCWSKLRSLFASCLDAISDFFSFLAESIIKPFKGE